MAGTVYDVLIELSKIHKNIRMLDGHSGGATDKFKFDLDKKSVSNGVISIIGYGELLMDYIELSDGTVFKVAGIPLIDDTEDFYAKVEKLYNQYKYSVPTKLDNSCRGNFMALHSDDLSFRQLHENMNRTQARYELEAYVLLMALAGKIEWSNDKHFYWQSKNDRTLILFRDWCRKESKNVRYSGIAMH